MRFICPSCHRALEGTRAEFPALPFCLDVSGTGACAGRSATDPETLAAARRMYGKAAFAQMMAGMKAADVPMPWALMHRVQAPTLLTWGRDDRVSPLDMALIPMRTWFPFTPSTVTVTSSPMTTDSPTRRVKISIVRALRRASSFSCRSDPRNCGRTAVRNIITTTRENHVATPHNVRDRPRSS